MSYARLNCMWPEKGEEIGNWLSLGIPECVRAMSYAS